MPKKPPRPSVRPPPRSSSTKTHRRSRPASSQEDTSGLPCQRAPAPPTRPQCSPRPPPPTPPHPRPSRASKELQTVHDQRMVKPHHPVRPPTKTVMSRWWKILERVTATHIISSRPKTRPQAQPTRRTSRDTSANNNKFTRLHRRAHQTRTTNGAFLLH